MIEEKLSEFLHVLRAYARWTQEDLAQKVGVTRQTINAIEKNRRKLTRTQALALLYVFKESPLLDNLIGTKDVWGE